MLLNLKEGEYIGQNLKSLDNSFLTLSITSYAPNCQIEKHYHENHYISILIKGCYYEKNTFEHNLISSGDILFRPNTYAHENLFTSYGGTCFNIEFKSEWEKQFASNLKLPNNFNHYKTGSFPSLYKLLVNFQNEFNDELAFEFICDWLFTINQNTHAKGFQPWVEKIARILENETECFHSLHSLSQRVFVHPVYLARAFKEKKGITIGEYQLKMKLANTISPLLGSSLSISDIAYKNGFYDDAHFIRSFKAVYKISPYKFRLTSKKLI